MEETIALHVEKIHSDGHVGVICENLGNCDGGERGHVWGGALGGLALKGADVGAVNSKCAFSVIGCDGTVPDTVVEQDLFKIGLARPI